ncbi:hypothetical protein GCM10007853_25660 [Algimonas ampicilliniresistens]|uniref:N-acetyltransferase domain-containing protein n=1 Tax=Algimonas ampicilliniresistens TaxID=1298735 RepID=A0ABQ5VCK5_9PROT|nr:GNAT family N-acetyltransferase [Algimonas ampicilliniresistens]GLQ24692.1 hypothetical protein GCM10007853_25660 [Algimonas ampicilliniresistens]
MLIPARQHLDTAACAERIYQSLDRFYDRLPLTHNQLIEILGLELSEDGTEVEHSYVIGNKTTDAFASVYPLDELKARQMGSTFHLMRATPVSEQKAMRAELSAHQKRVQSDVQDSDVPTTYLARIAVAKDRRGQGLGRAILQGMRNEGLIEGAMALHVAADNTPAIGFYRKLGLEFVGESDKPFRLMVGTLVL